MTPALRGLVEEVHALGEQRCDGIPCSTRPAGLPQRDELARHDRALIGVALDRQRWSRQAAGDALERATPRSAAVIGD